jgi:hypothetical protein
MMQLKTGQSRAGFAERRLMYDMTSSKHCKSFILFPYIQDAHDSMKTADKKTFIMVSQSKWRLMVRRYNPI